MEDLLATTETRKLIGKLSELGWYHSIALPDGKLIQGLQSVEQLQSRIAQFPIPTDLIGKRVLDIGAWDGWFSFEMERRGARVVAVDSTKSEKFLIARDLLGSRVEYHIADVYRLSPKDLGYFDLVLFFGVLYHLKHPLLALERVCELATDIACVESYVTDDGTNLDAAPAMEFYETTELRGQFDNWVGPNTACLLAFCRTAGFAGVHLESVISQRAHVTCRRHWPSVRMTVTAPFLICVENSVSRDHNFSIANDDYVALWFESAEANLTRENVFPEIGPFGSRPACVWNTGGDGWHINCKLPPGLSAGWHEARLRVGAGKFSNALRIGVDVPEARAAFSIPHSADRTITIASVTDGKTFVPCEVRAGANSCLSLWASGLPLNCHPREIRVRLNGADLAATFLSDPDPDGLRQINALLPCGLKTGEYSVAVVFGSLESSAVSLRLV